MKTSYSTLDRYRAFTLIELIILMAILAVVFVFVGPCKTNFSHGTGTKVGQVVKLSKQGWLRDTWEGQIVRGGLNAGSGGFSTVPFDFTVESEDLAKRVDELMRQQTEVVISYRIEGVYSGFRSESGGHFLTSIEPVSPNPKKN